MSMAAAACACEMVFTDCCDVGVEVPGVKITEVSLVELTDGARFAPITLCAVAVVGIAGEGSARLGGEAGPRAAIALFDELSISGVRSRAGAGGTKGEYCCAGLGRFLLAVLGRATGVVERASRSKSVTPPWYSCKARWWSANIQLIRGLYSG